LLINKCLLPLYRQTGVKPIINETMNEQTKEVLRVAHGELTQVQLKLKMVRFLLESGARVNERELDELLERYGYLKRLIEELEKQQ